MPSKKPVVRLMGTSANVKMRFIKCKMSADTEKEAFLPGRTGVERGEQVASYAMRVPFLLIDGLAN